MKPQSCPESDQLDLFQAQFGQLLSLDHPLCLVVVKSDRSQFDAAFAKMSR